MAAYGDFDSLPKVDGQPQGCAWGVWGASDELGTLNYLTPEVVKGASKEIESGVSVQLDLQLDYFNHRVAGREGFTHQIFDFKQRLPNTMYDFYGHDDVLTFNTQSSSQWDGFRHIGIQESAIYYNGMKHRDIDEAKDDGKLGIHSKSCLIQVTGHADGYYLTQEWVEGGGIVGRGVLLDYHSWRRATGKTHILANSSFPITTEELEEVARYQETEFHTGDILIVRTGFTAWYNESSEKERKISMDRGAFIGLESSMKSVKWLWNHHFAAVACDTLGFECTPIPFSDPSTTRLHDWLLAHWATPIGELWNLERLSEVCREERKWSFFLTSAPLHVYGGVGTPPNVIAVL